MKLSFLILGLKGTDASEPDQRVSTPVLGDEQKVWQFRIEDTVYEAHVQDVTFEWYLFFREYKSYCDNLGGGFQLPTPTNENEQAAVTKLRESTSTDFYLGISSQQVDGGEVTDHWWNLYTSKKIKFSNWEDGSDESEHYDEPTHVQMSRGGEWYSTNDFSLQGEIVCLRECKGDDECQISPGTSTDTFCTAGSCEDGLYCDNHISSMVASLSFSPNPHSERKSDGYCNACGESPTFCADRYFWSVDNYLDCERVCNGNADPIDFITVDQDEDNTPDIVNYAHDILESGCDRGNKPNGDKKPCTGPLGGIKRKLKKIVSKMVSIYSNNRAHVFCGFGKHRWWYKYGVDLNNQPYNYGTHFAMPYEVESGYDINADNFAVDGCSGFQKVLDVLHDWGLEYTRGCNGYWDDTKKAKWFTAYWPKMVRILQNNVNSKLTYAGNDGVFGNCEFDSGF